MFNGDLTTSKSGKQVNLRVIEQIVFLALEPGVRLRFDNKDNVARNDVRTLITFALKYDFGAILYTLIDMNVEHLALGNDLLSVTVLASVLLTNLLAFSVTVGADSLESLNHWAHLSHHGLHASTIAAGTFLNSSLLSSATVTLRADDILLECELRNLALIDILETDLVDVDNVA